MSARILLLLLTVTLLSTPTRAQDVVSMTTHSIVTLDRSVASSGVSERSGLLEVLQDAQRAYVDGDREAAIRSMEAFRDQVGGALPTSDAAGPAAEWLEVTNAVLGALESGLMLGGAVVGTGGAVLRVSDPTSPADGLELALPSGALPAETFVSVTVAQRPPEHAVLDFMGRGVTLEPAGLELSVPATLTLPVPSTGEASSSVLDRATKVGALDVLGRIFFPRPAIDPERNARTISISQFASYWNLGWRWSPGSVITYAFSWPRSGVSVALGSDLEGLQDSVRSAIGVWTPVAVQAGFSFEEVPDADAASLRFTFFSTDVPLTVRDRTTSSGLLPVVQGAAGDGAAQVYAFDRTRSSSAFTIAFNSRFGAAGGLAWTREARPDPSAVSMEAVAVHAIGHVLGLDDQRVDSGDLPVMASTADLLRPAVCPLRSDLQALRQIYGVSSLAPLPVCPNAGISIESEAEFSATGAGSFSEGTVRVLNTGRGTVLIDDLEASGDFEADLSGSDSVLDPGETALIATRFVPVSPGPSEGAVTVYSNAADSPHVVPIFATAPYDPPTCSLTAAQIVIDPGESATLAWTTGNDPTEGSIDNGIGRVDFEAGSVRVSPASTTTYTLSVMNPANVNSCSATVVVRSLPPGTPVWTRQFGSPNDDNVLAIAAETSGLFAAGESDSQLPDFGRGFLSRYDTAGNRVWMREIDNSRLEAVATDASGVYVAGTTESALGPEAAYGGPDAVVRKYTRDGSELWTRQFGSASRDMSTGLAVGGAALYVVGVTESQLPDQVHSGSLDGFVRKYDLEGNPIWTRQFGTSADDYVRGVAADSGGVVVAGETGGTLGDQTSSGLSDAFVRRYDAEGNEVWTRQFGTSAREFIQDVAVDASGIIAVGGTEGALPGQEGAGGFDAFLRRYGFDGEVSWTRQFGNPGTEAASAVATDSSWIFVVGTTEGALPGQSTLGDFDAFLRVYDRDGSEVWTRQFGTSASDDGIEVNVDQGGSIYVGGSTLGTFPDNANQGSSDAYLLRISK